MFLIWKVIGESVTGFVLGIDIVIYKLIGVVYGLYMDIASAEIFDNTLYTDIAQKLYIIIGIVALFACVYSLIQGMVDPDKAKDFKKIPKNLIIALVIICFVPTMFDVLFNVQNSILTYGTIPKAVLGELDGKDEISMTAFGCIDTSGVIYTKSSKDDTTYRDPDGNTVNANAIPNCEEFEEEITIPEVTRSLMRSYGYLLSYDILMGFVSPNNGKSPSQIIVKTSDFLSEEFQGNAVGTVGLVVAAVVMVVGGIVLCATGFGAGAGAASLAGAASVFSTIGVVNAGIIAGVAAGSITWGATEIIQVITAKEMTWAEITTYMQASGDFSVLAAALPNIRSGELSYMFIISSLCGGITLYMLVSFCLDLGVRAAKLAFYQMMAPISMMLSVIPGKEDTRGKWFKAVFTTWGEVFVRLLLIVLIAYLLQHLNKSNLAGSGLGLFAKAIVVMGIVTFVRMAPKLLSDLTGISSGDMKLGIKDKLKEGGLFAAAGFVGGTIAGRGNPFAGIRAAKTGWKDGKLTGIGAEAARRRETQLALRNGATRDGIMFQRFRGAFGFDTTQDRMDREIQEGINPVTHNNFRATNDTAATIEYIDSTGATQTLAVGSSVAMGLEMQENIARTKQANARTVARIAEESRHNTESQQQNQTAIDFRSQAKAEALDKIRERNSTVKKTISTSYGTFEGNIAALNEYLEKARLAGATAEQLKEISVEIGNAEDAAWKTYIDEVASGRISNGKIESIYARAMQYYDAQQLQSGAGVACDGADYAGLSYTGKTASAFINDLYSKANEYNNQMQLAVDALNRQKARVDEQNTGLDRLSAQLKEQQDIAQHTAQYLRQKANKDGMNNQDKTS